MSPYTLGIGGPADYEGLRRDVIGDFGEPRFDKLRTIDDAELRELLDGGRLFFARTDERYIGTVYVRDKAVLTTVPNPPRYAELGGMAIRPEYRGVLVLPRDLAVSAISAFLLDNFEPDPSQLRILAHIHAENTGVGVGLMRLGFKKIGATRIVRGPGFEAMPVDADGFIPVTELELSRKGMIGALKTFGKLIPVHGFGGQYSVEDDVEYAIAELEKLGDL